MSSANSDTLPGEPTQRKTKQDNALPELPIEALVDSECGVIRSVREVPHPTGAPQAYLGLTAAVADARQLGEWPADRVSLGTSFSDPAQARIAAIAEGIERYCGNWLPAELPLRAAHRQLRGADVGTGLSLIGLDDLPSFASWQYERAGFPYAPLTADTPTLWTRCTDLLGADVWMPASLVYQLAVISVPRPAAHPSPQLRGHRHGSGSRRRPRPRRAGDHRTRRTRAVVAPRRPYHRHSSTRPPCPACSTTWPAATSRSRWQ